MRLKPSLSMKNFVRSRDHIHLLPPLAQRTLRVLQSQDAEGVEMTAPELTRLLLEQAEQVEYCAGDYTAWSKSVGYPVAELMRKAAAVLSQPAPSAEAPVPTSGPFCGHDGRHCFRKDRACLKEGRCVGVDPHMPSAEAQGDGGGVLISKDFLLKLNELLAGMAEITAYPAYENQCRRFIEKITSALAAPLSTPQRSEGAPDNAAPQDRAATLADSYQGESVKPAVAAPSAQNIKDET